jgi:hypothetical protein
MPSNERISNENASYDDTLYWSLFLSATPAFHWSKAPKSPGNGTVFHDFSDSQLIIEAPTFAATASRVGVKDLITIIQAIDLSLYGVRSLMGAWLGSQMCYCTIRFRSSK